MEIQGFFFYAFLLFVFAIVAVGSIINGFRLRRIQNRKDEFASQVAKYDQALEELAKDPKNAVMRVAVLKKGRHLADLQRDDKMVLGKWFDLMRTWNALEDFSIYDEERLQNDLSAYGGVDAE